MIMTWNLRRISIVLIALVAINGFIPIVQVASSWETDMTSVVNWVIDGDTFNVTSGDRIRLADIDAPEQGESGYLEAKNFLISLIYGKSVYLDVDDLSGTDPYGRLVCVVFVDYNSTHVINVNKALLVENVAVIKNYTNNEFDPCTWSLYVPITVIPEIPNIVTLMILLSMVGLSAILLKKKFDL